MPYGEIRVDTITFTNGGADTSITVSGLAASTTGNLTVTGTVSGTTATFVTGVFTSSISGAVITTQSGIIASGTAGNPSLSFIGDANTGLYSPGADQVAISTSGTGRLFVTSAGTIGVNTSSPAASFHISAAVPRVRVSVSGNPNQYSDFFNSNGSTFIDSRNDTLNGPIVFRGAASGVTDEYSRFDAVGRFLHGYSSSVDTRNYLNNTYGGPYYQRHGLTQAETVTALYNWSTSNAAGASIVLNKSLSGTIGTRGALTTNGTDLGAITFTGDDGTTFVPAAAILAELDGTPGTNDMPGRLAFLTTADGASAPTERMRITQAGDVGIGTNNPGARLHISNGTDTSVGEFTALTIGGTNITSARTGSIIKDTTTYDLIYKNQNFSSSTGSHVFRNGPEEHLRIDSNGRLLIGTSTALNLSGIAGFEGIQLAGTTGFSSASLSRFSVDETGSFITFAKSRGASVGTNAVVTTGDDIGTINFTAADGTGYISAARIRVEVDGTPGTNDMPGRLTFSTTADGASSPTERMRIDSAGRVGIGTTNSVGKLTVATSSADPSTALSAWSDGYFVVTPGGTTTSGGIGLSFNTSTNIGGISCAAPGSAWRDLIYKASAHRFELGGSEAARIDSAGRVGIGTTQPVALLQVGTGVLTPSTSKVIVNTNDAAIAGITVSNWTNSSTSNGPRIRFDNSTRGVFTIGGGNGVHSFVIRDEQVSSDRLTIDNSGRILVGTSTDSGGALLQVNGDRVRIATAKTPASATDTGTTGEVCWDANYVYVCVATNTWKRSAISTW